MGVNQDAWHLGTMRPSPGFGNERLLDGTSNSKTSASVDSGYGRRGDSFRAAGTGGRWRSPKEAVLSPAMPVPQGHGVILPRLRHGSVHGMPSPRAHSPKCPLQSPGGILHPGDRCGYLVNFGRECAGKDRLRLPYLLSFAILVIFSLFFILRNIPFECLDIVRPPR